MFIRFITIRRIPKNECVCQKLQKGLRYLWVNSVQVTYEGASLEGSTSIPQLHRWFNVS